jgi:WD repeat-containing protein 55
MDDSASSDVRDIRCGAQAFDIAFHPRSDILAIGLVTGHLQLHAYSSAGNKKVVDARLHAGAVRATRFTDDGAALFTGGSDGALRRVEGSGAVSWERPEGHAAAVNSVVPFAGFMVASGDEDGAVKLWDTRLAGTGRPAVAMGGGGAAAAAAAAAASSSSSSSPAPSPAPVSFSAQEDSIASLHVDLDRATLLAASCDGTLGVYDLRRARLAARTEQEDDELLSLQVMKRGGAVVCGTQDGALLTYDWGKWTPATGAADTGPERFTGHPESVDALLAVDDDTLVTGSSDGILRLVTVRPFKLVGVLGEHDDFPIERLAWSRDKRYIGSVSHDERVKFWDVAYLFEEDEDEEEEGAAAAAAAAAKAKGKGKKKTAETKSSGSKFLGMPALRMPARLAEDDDDNDDEDVDSGDDDDEEEEDDEDGDDGMAAAAAAAASSRGAHRGAGAGAGTKKGAGGGKKGGGKKGGGGAGFFDDLD